MLHILGTTGFIGQQETNRPLSENNSGAIGGRGRTDIHGTEHISKYRSLVPHGGRTSVFTGIAEGDVQCGHPDSWAEFVAA